MEDSIPSGVTFFKRPLNLVQFLLVLKSTHDRIVNNFSFYVPKSNFHLHFVVNYRLGHKEVVIKTPPYPQIQKMPSQQD